MIKFEIHSKIFFFGPNKADKTRSDKQVFFT